MPARTAVVVDPHPLWLGAIGRALRSSEVEVVGATDSLRAATGLIEQIRPDLAVIETVDTGQEPFVWLGEQQQHYPAMKMIVFSGRDDPDAIASAFRSGASAYVVKRADSVEFTAAVRQLEVRSIFLPNDTRVAEHVESPAVARAALTRRERDMLALVAEGWSNKEMARRLWVTEQTIKFHLSNVYRKLRVANRTQASRWAHQHGVLSSLAE